ncbi:LamG domain-containing protein [Hymenobacter mucosus]|uniref:hypothetical protein n=1 Tax=Hymenobacter mucosus TaxID=1411120 RepID=UPI00117A1BD4|nr:hypothetical protein [Hymenobacter mucosus]
MRITSFTALANYAGETDAPAGQLIRRYNAEMTIRRPGRVFPHPEGSSESPALFNCRLTIANTSERDTLFYALFYQNESYAFEPGHPRDDENFYGTWGYDEGKQPGFRKIAVPRRAGGTTLQAGVRLRGNPRNESLFMDAPAGSRPLPDGPDDENLYGRWKRPPRMGRYRFMLVVTTDTSEIDFYARDCHRRRSDGHYLNPFTYFLGRSFAHTVVQVADEQLQIYMRPPKLGAPLPARDWRMPATAEQMEASFRYSSFGGAKMPNVPVVADVNNNSFTPAAYNRLKHQFDPTTLPVVTVGDDGPTASVADSGRIQLINPAADPADPHKYDASVRTLFGFTYGRFRARIRFPQIVNSAGVWNGISPAFWLFSAAGEPWNSLNRDYRGGFCTDDERAFFSEIDIEIFKAQCIRYRNYRNDGYEGRARHRRRWLREGGAFQDESCDSIVIGCNNFDYMRQDIPHLVNGAAATPPCGANGNDEPIVYEGKTYRLHRDGASTALSTRVVLSSTELFSPHDTWYEIEWRPTEIIWRIGPDENHLRVIAYMSDQYTVVPNTLMHVILAQHWLPTNDYHPYFQENIPYPAFPIRGEILEFSVE